MPENHLLTTADYQMPRVFSADDGDYYRLKGCVMNAVHTVTGVKRDLQLLHARNSPKRDVELKNNNK